ncbi:hypothetical protein KQR54_18825 [Mycobacterium gordonae]|nr:hypothetical protein [Mycobacterium gordonae]
MPEWIIQLALGIMIAAIAYFLKRYDSQQTKRSDDQQDQITALNRELQQFKLEAADRYVHKDDFIRAMSTTDRKLDKIYDEILKINQGRGSA